MEDTEKYVTVRERQLKAFGERLEKILKQYSVVKVNDVKGAHHGVDYEEMKREILDMI